MALMVAQEVPASSTMAVPHGPAGVGTARRRKPAAPHAPGAAESVVDDAVLILSELLSNSCRHARPLSTDRCIQAGWRRDSGGALTISVTDGGGPTRPLPATPSVSARGGRGLAIITALAHDWGVEEEVQECAAGLGGEAGDSTGVTVWAQLSPSPGEARRVGGRASGRNGGTAHGSPGPAPAPRLPVSRAPAEDLDLQG